MLEVSVRVMKVFSNMSMKDSIIVVMEIDHLSL